MGLLEDQSRGDSGQTVLEDSEADQTKFPCSPQALTPTSPDSFLAPSLPTFNCYLL